MVENPKRQAAGALPVLWSERQLPRNQQLLSANAGAGAQVVEPAESEAKYELGKVLRLPQSLPASEAVNPAQLLCRVSVLCEINRRAGCGKSTSPVL
jgi:hypothetical protein